MTRIFCACTECEMNGEDHYCLAEKVIMSEDTDETVFCSGWDNEKKED